MKSALSVNVPNVGEREVDGASQDVVLEPATNPSCACPASISDGAPTGGPRPHVRRCPPDRSPSRRRVRRSPAPWSARSRGGAPQSRREQGGCASARSRQRSVGVTPARSNKATPSMSSRSLRLRVSDGWETRSAAAARLKFTMLRENANELHVPDGMHDNPLIMTTYRRWYWTRNAKCWTRLSTSSILRDGLLWDQRPSC